MHTHGRMQNNMFCSLRPCLGLAMARLRDVKSLFALETCESGFQPQQLKNHKSQAQILSLLETFSRSTFSRSC